MSLLGYVPVPLPSRGVFYDGKIPDGTVHIRKATVMEECKIQAASSMHSVLNTLISTCCKLPAGMSSGDLLITDRVAILIALRVYTFGPLYDYVYRCQSCGTSQKNTVDFSQDLTVQGPPDDAVEPLLLRLTDADREIGVRQLRGKDEDIIAKSARKVRMANNDEADTSNLTRMALQVVSIDGEDVSDKRDVKEKFISGLTMADAADLRDAVASLESGVDTTVNPICESCGNVNTLAIPVTLEFFRPSRSRFQRASGR